MQTVQLGKAGPQSSKVGWGSAAVSGSYGPVKDQSESVAAVHSAIDAGITLIDGGDFYGAGRGELVIGEALKTRKREDVLLSIKYGGRIDVDRRWHGHDVSPMATKTMITYTLTRLGVDYIDIYRPARFDPGVEPEETIGAIAELIEKGYVRYIGLSEVGPEYLRRAAAVHPITDVQVEYSLLSRGIEDELIPAARELGVSITAYGVLARGLLSWTPGREIVRGDSRAHAPRFQGENLERNLQLVDALRKIADGHGVSVGQLAIAWVAAQGDDIVPLLGSRNPEQLTEAVGALDVELSTEDLAAIEAAVPRGAAAGERYPDQILNMLDPSIRQS
jgi:aryl-alcohol dehydrogenase-like predicted oxidoreductase